MRSTRPNTDRGRALCALVLLSTAVAASVVVACSSEDRSLGEVTPGDAALETETDAASEATIDATSPTDASDLFDAGPPLAVTCAQEPCAVALSGVLQSSGTFCVLLDTGKVACWGRNYDYFLGGGADAGSAASAVPQEVVGVENAIALEGSCAIRQGGAVTCWGPGNYLQPNPPLFNKYRDPVTLPIPSVRSLSVWGTVGCAVFVAGGVSCWGFVAPSPLDGGRTIYGSTDNTLVSFPLESGFIPVAVQVGAASFLRDATGAVLSWGARTTLGRISSLRLDPEAQPIALRGVTAMDVVGEAACAVAQGKVYCWGSVDGPFIPDHPLPELVQLPVPAVAVSLGSTAGLSQDHPFACAITVDHDLYCWGDNSVGQVGDGTIGNIAYSPVKVALPGRVVSVRAFQYAACALLESGQVHCWGVNTSGELGRGTMGKPKPTPDLVVFP